MLKSSIVFGSLLGLTWSAAALEREVKFSSGTASVSYGTYSSTGFSAEKGRLTLHSIAGESTKANLILSAWFESNGSGKRFLIRPHGSSLMKNCPKLAGQIDIQIRGFKADGKEAGYFETKANVVCHDLNVSGYDYDQYLLVTLYDVDELFNYFWDYSGVEVDFSLGRLDNEDQDFYLMFSAQNFRKSYKNFR